MVIIKGGGYPIENKAICNECKCEFMYYNSEVITDSSSLDEQELLDGIAIYKYVLCPNCRNKITVSYNFYENESILKNIKEKFMKFIKKNKSIKGDEE